MWWLIPAFAGVLVGIVAWYFLDKAFRGPIPNYISALGISFFWDSTYKPERLDQVDRAAKMLIEEFVLVFPEVKIEMLKEHFKIVKVRFCSDWDNELYVLKEEARNPAKEYISLHSDGMVRVLCNGVCRNNYISLRKLSTDVFRTALVHELMETCLVKTGHLDLTHSNKILWESEGIVGKILREIG